MGSDSGDQFKLEEHPDSDEEDDLEDDVESEEGSGNKLANNESTKAKSQKGKHKLDARTSKQNAKPM